VTAERLKISRKLAIAALMAVCRRLSDTDIHPAAEAKRKLPYCSPAKEGTTFAGYDTHAYGMRDSIVALFLGLYGDLIRPS
jgi:hypothetical protein